MIIVKYLLKWVKNEMKGKINEKYYIKVVMVGEVMMVMEYNEEKIVKDGIKKISEEIFESVGKYEVRKIE